MESKKLNEFCEQHKEFIVDISFSDANLANENSEIVGVKPHTEIEGQHLVFLGKVKDLSIAAQSFQKNPRSRSPLFLVCDEKLKGTSEFQDLTHPDVIKNPWIIFWVKSVRLAMAKILPDFDPRKNLTHPPSISSVAYIHPNAQIHPSAQISPNAYIGAFAELGAYTKIGPGAVIESFCKLGSRVAIGANTVIGQAGFGYWEDTQKGHHLPIPQIGNVILDDDVEIGACCTIDRATLGSTKIGAYTKIDNLAHIAHNCEIGRSCLIAAGFSVAGSTKIGNFFVCGGSVSVSDHVKICDGVMVGGLSGIVGDITKPGKYKGYPLERLSDGLKTIQNLRHLSRFRKDLSLIKKKLGLN